jgi:hypothetical protein
MLERFLSLFKQEFFLRVLDFTIDSMPVWAPILLFVLLVKTWLRYKQALWIHEQGSILLEIKLPKEITKSPAAMELVFYGLWEDVVGTLLDVYLKGQVRYWFSLEIVSIGGEVKFFIWTMPKWKNIVESRIYAQYPGAEVVEVKDYTLDTVFNPNEVKIWGSQLALAKPDAYPIKTYVDYGLDKESTEEEEKVDPLTPFLEYLGSLKAGEQVWFQILIEAHRKEGFQDARIFKKPDWKEAAKKEIKKIIEEEAFIKSEGEKPATLLGLTSTQTETIKAIERSLGKHVFNTGMRVLYVAKNDAYDSMAGMGLIGSIRQFGSYNLNGIKPVWFTGLAYPWQDFGGARKRRRQRMIFDAYKRRSFFHEPYKFFKARPFVLTTEELATVFHFPGSVATTPTVPRVVSKKTTAPPNLPI